MNTLVRPCDVEHILLDVDIQDRRQLFETVGRFLSPQRQDAASAIARQLDERETLGSTGLGQGVAIPHARLRDLATPIAVLVRTALPIAFGAPDDKLVDLFFILLVPEQATQEHLQRLADAARILCERRVRDGLRTSVSIADVHAVMRDGGQS
ncbi:PTS sugar transporter subunit IIA [Paludibacterium purpuratum]|nr:PTS sugar transporter subunit IIA [Paludibacterium purpuratum]